MKNRQIIVMVMSLLIGFLLLQGMWYTTYAVNTGLQLYNVDDGSVTIIEPQWNYTYGGIRDDCLWWSSLIQTGDEGLLVAGQTLSFGAGSSDMWLVKTDSKGNLQWNQTYGGEESDRAFSVIETSDGGFLLGGFTRSYGVEDADAFLVKTFQNGTLQWNHTYGGAEFDKAWSLLETSDGGVLVAGYTNSYNAENEDAWLFKVSSNGTIQWNHTYGGVSRDWFHTIIEINDGFLCAGRGHGQGIGSEDAWLVKTDLDGIMQWEKTYGGIDAEVVYSITQDSNGELLLAGSTQSYSEGRAGYLVKTSSDGTMLWNKTLAGVDADDFYSLIQTRDGDFLTVGKTYTYGTFGSDIWVAKFQSDGVINWNRSFNLGGEDEGYSVIETTQGNYVIAGHSNSQETNTDLWLINVIERSEIPSSESTVSETASSNSSHSSESSTTTSPATTTSSEVIYLIGMFMIVVILRRYRNRI